MDKSNIFKLYSVSFIIMLLIDLVWLNVMTPILYKPNLEKIFLDQAFIPAAIVFYLVYILGITIFVTIPKYNLSNFKILIYGAFFGLCCYATYDLTNQATIKNWPIFITIIDLIWGSFLTAITSLATIIIHKKYLNK